MTSPRPTIITISRAALERCTPMQRIVVVETLIKRRRDPDVAAELGITERAIRKHRAAATSRIRAYFEETT